MIPIIPPNILNPKVSMYPLSKEGKSFIQEFEEVFKDVELNDDILEKIFVKVDARPQDLKWIYDKALEYNQIIDNIDECVIKSVKSYIKETIERQNMIEKMTKALFGF